MKDLSGFSQPSHEETGRSQETLASEQIVDPEPRDLLPPLKDDESKLLEQDIVEHGCRDPLVTWNGILVDGYRRLEYAGVARSPTRSPRSSCPTGRLR